MKAFNVINHLQLKNVDFEFPGEELLFENINYEFPQNQNVRVIGATGAGKSAFLKIIAGLLLPTNGQYLIDGVPVSELSFEEFTNYRLNIGYSFEFGGLLNNKSLLDNIILPMDYHRQFTIEGGRQRVLDLIERAGLSKTHHLRPSMVPGSHRKMTIVLRAFVMRPQLLVLDEPTAGLTLENKKFLLELIAEEKKMGNLKAIIFSSNDDIFIKNLADNNIYLRDKKIISAVQALQEEAG